jgi:hypothetical protein
MAGAPSPWPSQEKLAPLIFRGQKMDNKLSISRRKYAYAFSGIILAMGSGCFVEAASINEFVIVPPNPMSDDLVQVTIKGSWSGGHVSCIPGEPDISINGKNIQVHYTTPSNPSVCSTIGTLPGSVWADTIPIWQTTGKLETGTYQLEITSAIGEIMLRTAFSVSSKRDVGGLVTGINTHKIICKNLATGKKKVIQNDIGAWNCEASGLRVKPGDKIEQRVIGTTINPGIP